MTPNEFYFNSGLRTKKSGGGSICARLSKTKLRDSDGNFQKWQKMLRWCPPLGVTATLRGHAGVASVRAIRAEERASRLQLIAHTDLEGIHKHTRTHPRVRGGGVWSLQRREIWVSGEGSYIWPRYQRVPSSSNFSLFLYLSHSKMSVESTD